MVSEKLKQTKSIDAFFQALGLRSYTNVADAIEGILESADFKPLNLPDELGIRLAKTEISNMNSTVSYDEVGLTMVVRRVQLLFTLSPPLSKSTTLRLDGEKLPLTSGLLQLDWPKDAKSAFTMRTDLDFGIGQDSLKLSVLRKGQPLLGMPPIKVSEQRARWLKDIKEKAGENRPASSLIKGLVALVDMLHELAEFEGPAKETVVMIDKVLGSLELTENAKIILTDPLQRYLDIRNNFQLALRGARSMVNLTTTQIREGLNLSSTATLHAIFFPQDGVLLLDWDNAQPRQYLSKADMSKLAWEINVSKNNQTAPNNDIIVNPAMKVETKDGATMNTKISKEELKGAKEICVWLRAKYTYVNVSENEESITSAVWKAANVLIVDDALASRFGSLFTFKGKPTVALNEASIQADWTSVVPDSVMQDLYSKTEFRHLGNIKWEVVVSPTSNPADVGATRELFAINNTKTEKLNAKLSNMTAVVVLVRVVLDVGIGGFSRLEGPWAIGDASRHLPLSTLDSGQSLAQGEYLTSFFDSNRLDENRFVLQSDGNFVLYHMSNGGQSTQAVWASKTNGRAVRATMQAHGNLVLFHSLGVSSWSSGTSNEGASLILQDNGNAVICAKNGRNVWATGTRRLKTISQRDRLQVGEMLLPGQELQSPNGRYKLALQADTNFVIYYGTTPTWAIGTSPGGVNGVEMGEDDNLVVYRSSVWETNTRRRVGGGKGALIMRDDGIAVVISDETIIWATDSSFVQPCEPVDLIAVKQGSDRMRPGEYLSKGLSLTSLNEVYTATLQNDGNFVLYEHRVGSTRLALWHTRTNSSAITRLCFGLYPRKLILYEQGAKFKWAPENREYDEDAILLMGNDGNLSLISEKADPYKYDKKSNEKRWWSTKTVFPAFQGAISSLRCGESLAGNERLVSSNGKFELYFTTSGDLFIMSDNTQVFWKDVSNLTNPSITPRELRLTSDGFLEIRAADGTSMWKDGPSRNDVTQFVLTDTGSAYWTNDSLSENIWPLYPNGLGTRLLTGASLCSGQRINSQNGRYTFVLQDDDNLVLYNLVPSSRPVWATNTWNRGTERLVLQEDGDLVLSDSKKIAHWRSGTKVEGGKKTDRVLEIRDDGDVVLLDRGTVKIWSTETAGG